MASINGRLDRRTLLRGAGTLMALPLLEAMAPLSAMAQTGAKRVAAPPRRMAFLFVPNGMNMKFWTPEGAGGALALPDIMAPLAPVKDSLLVLTGLTQKNAFALGDGGGDHARSAATWLTGCHPRKTSGADIKAGVSADQIAARYLGNMTRFPSLELSCEGGRLAGDCDSGYSCAYSNTISWRGPATPVAREINPRAVFERLFGNGEDADAKTPEARARRRAENASVLDAVIEEAGQLKLSLGSHDREKVDEYFQSVREIEHRLQFAEQNTNLAYTVAKNKQGMSLDTPADYMEHIRLMGDMMVLAFQLDMTRVVSFMLASEGSNRSYRQIGIAEGHHELSHHGGSVEKLEKIKQINRFHVEQLAYILQKMQSVKEGNGTLLDNTLVVYGGGISDGDRHNHNNLPILVAGGRGVVKTGGRHIVYPDGTPMTNLFMTVFDRMGMPSEKIGSIGDSTGKLAQLF